MTQEERQQEIKRIAKCLVTNWKRCSPYCWLIMLDWAERIVDGEKPPHFFRQEWTRRKYKSLGGTNLPI